MEGGKLGGILPQWAFRLVVLAAAPEFVGGGVEEYGRPLGQQFAILLLDKGSAAEGDDTVSFWWVS